MSDYVAQIKKIDFRPRPIVVYVEVNPPGRKPFIGRVGTCHSLAEARQLVADDLKAMGDTLGGLIEPVSKKGRRYFAFKAEWTPFEL